MLFCFVTSPPTMLQLGCPLEQREEGNTGAELGSTSRPQLCILSSVSISTAWGQG